MTSLDYRTFSGFVTGNKFALVHFWAAWNGYDTQMKAILDELEPLFPSIAFGSVDTDPTEHHELCRSLGITNLPWLSIFKEGNQADSIGGLKKFDQLVEDLRGALQRLS